MLFVYHISGTENNVTKGNVIKTRQERSSSVENRGSKWKPVTDLSAENWQSTKEFSTTDTLGRLL